MLHLRQDVYRNPIFWVVVALTTIALLLGLGLAYFSAELNSLFSEQNEYSEYVSVVDDLNLNLFKAESGQRGYLITQNPNYLKPYDNALPQITKDVDELTSQHIGSPYKKQLGQIVTLVNQKKAEMVSTIKALQTDGQAAAFSIVNDNRGLSDMDKLRQLLDSVTHPLKSKLQKDMNVAQATVDQLKYLAPVVALLDIFLVVAIFLLTTRAVRREQQLDDLKEQFVALASHQLRTPATAVKQYLSLLLMGTFGKLKKEQRDVLTIINESNERGIRIANSLLNISRADSQRLIVSDEPIDLSQLLEHVMKHYTEAIKESKNQTLVLDMPKKPVLGKVDPFYIRLIFDNLVENASKYSPDGTTIRVKLREKADVITFSVKDQGFGISKKDIPLLFNKFSRLNQAIKTTEGSGLGLYLVKQSAELHGGNVEVQSAIGKGTTFIVNFRKGM